MKRPDPCRRSSVLVAAFLVSSAALDAAAGQAVWRCGPDGRTFADRPCADGAPVSAHAVDTPTAERRLAATETAQRERQFADRLQEDRLAREAEYAARGSGLTGIEWAGAPRRAVNPSRPGRPGRPNKDVLGAWPAAQAEGTATPAPRRRAGARTSPAAALATPDTAD